MASKIVTGLKLAVIGVAALSALIFGVIEGRSSMGFTSADAVAVTVDSTWSVPSGKSRKGYARIRYSDGHTSEVSLPLALVGKLPAGHRTVAWRSFSDEWIREYNGEKMDGASQFWAGVLALTALAGLAAFIVIRDRRARTAA